MNQDRASTINNSQLKEGYKQTELGVIPEDWKIERIGDCTKIFVGGDLNEKNYSTYQDDIFKYPVFSNTVTNEGLYGFYDVAEYEGESLTIIGRGVGLGTTFKKSGKYAAIGRLLVLFPEIGVDAGFLTEYINYRVNIFSESGGIPQLTGTSISKYKVVLPPTKEEQEAIAHTLSDIDALIESLDRLLTKKRQIKQGAMQELLRSKDGWIEHPFSEICWFQEGPGVRNHQFTSAGVKLFNGTNIEKGKIDLDKTNRYISEREAFGWYSHFLADVGDIVIACSGISIDKFDEKVAVIDAQHLPLCMNTSTMRFKVKQEMLDRYYLLHFLRSSSFKSQIGGTATGSAQLNFGPSHVSVVKIQLPGLSEQIEIANILSDMDAEIDSIESKLAKTRQLKQGMMHELLTGKIRLVSNS
jgi:type I restriction enzyme, S subunit